MKQKPRGVGRPRSGPDDTKVSDYPRLTVRLPRSTKDQLEGLAWLKRRAVWELIDSAVRAYIDALPDDERRELLRFSRRIAPVR